MNGISRKFSIKNSHHDTKKLTIAESMPKTTTRDDFEEDIKKPRGREKYNDRDNNVANVNIPSYFTKNEAKIIKELADENMEKNSKTIRKIVVKHLKEIGKL